MEDADEGEADNTVADVEIEDDNGDADADGEPDDDIDETQDGILPSHPNHATSDHSQRPPQVNGARSHEDRDPDTRGHPRTPQSHDYNEQGSPKSYHPPIRPEALTALVYDIAPTIAAPHSTSINTIAATPDMRWVFSGGSDGWVRKFNWIDTANGKTLLTVAQRHPFVDSVTKAGVLMSYWENEDTLDKSDDEHALSPVYSLVVHHQALWLLSGTESGGINLQTVRHQEGHRITTLHGHTSAVSVMQLSNDETSLLSGSWDKTVQQWDLNTGQTKTAYTGSGGQISAIETRPESNVPIPRHVITAPEPTLTNGTFASNNNIANNHRASISQSRRESKVSQLGGIGSPSDSLFGGGGADDASLFGDDDAGGNLVFNPDDDDFSRALANGIQEQSQLNGDNDMDLTMPDIGGPDDALLNPLPEDMDSAPTVLDTTIPPPTSPPPATSNPTSIDPLAPPPPPTSTTNDFDPASHSPHTFLTASIDGSLRLYDVRLPTAIATIPLPRNTPPWCMAATWSPDGNSIYVGRRNNTVEEYSLHKGFADGPSRTLKLPGGSGAVSAVRAMPNRRSLLVASHDILRLWDLEQDVSAPTGAAGGGGKVPFLIVPGHRTGVVSQLYIDPKCEFLISTGGNRGWEGASTEVLLGYEISCLQK